MPDWFSFLLPLTFGGTATYEFARNLWRKYLADRATYLVCRSPNVDGVVERRQGIFGLLESR